MTPVREGGSASVLALGIGLALLTIALGLQAVGSAVVARHRAAVAADLAALSGALHVPAGPAAACASARDIAGRNGAYLAHCTVTDRDITVVVTVSSRVGVAEVRSRAGPVTAG
ncbi:Rv3654c family TadE-like protein [Cryptosporangium sp. NPDC051539]|uniref:Rv3654c family TadE-like protein n=1 Tax=Cryptosporangium sp. NPDC051539 TaxID=3363962 RepID=UPI0037BAC682